MGSYCSNCAQMASTSAGVNCLETSDIQGMYCLKIIHYGMYEGIYLRDDHLRDFFTALHDLLTAKREVKFINILLKDVVKPHFGIQ